MKLRVEISDDHRTVRVVLPRRRSAATVGVDERAEHDAERDEHEGLGGPEDGEVDVAHVLTMRARTTSQR